MFNDTPKLRRFAFGLLSFAALNLNAPSPALASGDYEEVSAVVTGGCAKAQLFTHPVAKGTTCLAYVGYARTWQRYGDRLTGPTNPWVEASSRPKGRPVWAWVVRYNPETGKYTDVTAPREIKLNQVGEKLYFKVETTGYYYIVFDYYGERKFWDSAKGVYEIHVRNN